jgi:hypothetical protein
VWDLPTMATGDEIKGKEMHFKCISNMQVE